MHLPDQQRDQQRTQDRALPPIALCDRQGYTRRLYPNRHTIPFEIDVLGRRFRLAISYVDAPAALIDLVPMARALSDVLTEQLKVTLEGFGRQPSCRKGCAHCCYYLVPISTAEAFCLTREVLAISEPLRSALIRMFHLAGRRLLSRPPQDAGSAAPADRRLGPSRRLRYLSDWYASLHLACPFLADRACAIYDLRPLACREYWVTSDPRHCRLFSPGRVDTAPLPVRIAEVLSETCGRLEGQHDTILLPLALPFAQDHSPRAARRWPARVLVRCFLETLFDRIHTNLAAPDMTPRITTA